MLRKSLNRNQRSKGIKIKRVLQICLLLGVCFWLIYQVKHSHEKRKEFDEKDAKASVKAQSDDVILKFGRKDLPHEQEVSKNYKYEEEENGVEEENKHDEEQEEKTKRLEEEEQEGTRRHDEEEQEVGSKHEEEEQEEGSKHEEEEREEGSKHEEEREEGSKHEEEEQEEASKHEEEEQEEVRENEGSKHEDEEQEAEIKDEEAEDEGRRDGDDEVDENEQERADGEADHEEEFIDEKEREAEGDDKENEENENEEKEKEGQEESGNLANDQNQDGGGRNAHEAREEHYKADDASSAVSHNTQIINSEADKLDMENSNDNSTMNVLKLESKANTTEEANGDENKSELKVDEGKNSGGDSSLNVTYTKENDRETGSSNTEYISLPNATHTTDFIDQASNNSMKVSKETGNKPAEVNTEMPGSLQNETSAQKTTEDGMVTEEKYKEQANETISNSKLPDSNTIDSSKIENVDLATRDSSNSSINAESGMSEDIAKINATAGGDSFGSSMTKEIIDSTQNKKSEGDNESSGTDESSDTSSSNETVDGGLHDPIDSSDNSILQEEKDARVDLSTLPDITTEGSNNEDAAAE